MKNNKGFTLVELVVVVAILLALATIATVSVTAVLNKSDKDIDTIQNKMIEKAALACLEAGECDCNTTSTERTCEISSQKLIDNQFLDAGDASGSESVTVFKNSDGSFNTVEKDSYVNNVRDYTRGGSTNKQASYDYFSGDIIVFTPAEYNTYSYYKEISIGKLKKNDKIEIDYKCDFRPDGKHDMIDNVNINYYESTGSSSGSSRKYCQTEYKTEYITISKDGNYSVYFKISSKNIEKLYIKNLKVIKGS